jgi:hypothetical protein
MKSVIYLFVALLFSFSAVYGQGVHLCVEPASGNTKWIVRSCDGKSLSESDFQPGQRIFLHTSNTNNASDSEKGVGGAKESRPVNNPLDTIRWNGGGGGGGNVVVVWPHGAHITFSDRDKQIILLELQNEIRAIRGLDELNASFSPNPVSGSSVHLKNHKNVANVEIIDAHGKTVTPGQLDADGNLNIDNLKPGVYYITVVYSDGRRVVLKIIKEG